jgi:hypothetical protein
MPMLAMVDTDERHPYDPECYCDRCDAQRRAQALREAMLHDDAWLMEWGKWRASPWNIGGGKRLEELEILGMNAYIGKRHHSAPPAPVKYSDIDDAVARLDERSQACIELYYVLGVGLPAPKSYPDMDPEEIEAMIRHQAWTADDGWGDTGVARAFARAVEAGELVEEGGLRWRLTPQRWGQIRHAAIGVIVRRVTGG